MARIRWHAEAKIEVKESAFWYAKSSIENARRFRMRLNEVVLLVSQQPQLFGWYDDDFRMVILTPYPYAIIYRERPGNIVQVIAVAHTSREPGYWKDRVS